MILLPVLLLMALGLAVFLVRPSHEAAFLFLLFAASTAINDAIQLTHPEGGDLTHVYLMVVYTMTSLLGPAILLHLFLVFPWRGPVQQRLRPFLVLAYGIPLALVGELLGEEIMQSEED